jgi:hypothetical protein
MNRNYNRKLYLTLLIGSLGITGLKAQSLKTQILLNDLSSFNSAPKNWEIVKNVHADLDIDNKLLLEDGTGILVNKIDKKKQSSDLIFNLQHGDIDLEMDFMVAKGANSGIFLQGRYELQLVDSWGKLNPRSMDNGAVDERWDGAKPEGKKGYEGYAPRQNVSRAPGLWQHLKLSFQSPRFDAQGKKTENAKLLYVWLNGIMIQENLVLSGPTHYATDSKESPTGHLKIQGDQGAVAFKNISYTSFDKPHPVLSQLKYAVYKGNFLEEPDYSKLKPVAEGSPLLLTSNEVKIDNEFILKFNGTLRIAEPGDYKFKLSVPGGKGTFKVNGIKAVDTKEFTGEGIATLPAGDLPFEIYYNKSVDWAKAALGLTVSGPGIREYLLSDANVNSLDAVDPILINSSENSILRSFTDLPGNIRVSHAVGVGSVEQLHYTYDLDNGMIVQIWRGNFLDATPMWHERGDGSSKPSGSVQYLGKPAPVIYQLSNADSQWLKDTVGTSFKPKGYNLDKEGRPTFKYMIYNALVTDVSRVMPEGQGIKREISISAPIPNSMVRVVSGTNITLLKSGLYDVDGSYYISIEPEPGVKPMLRSAGGMQELIIPIKQKLAYSIIL